MGTAAIASELRYLAPEIAILVVAAAAMFAHLFFRRRGGRMAGYVAFAGIAAVCGVLLLTPQSAGGILAESMIADRRLFFNETVNIYNTRIELVPQAFFAIILRYKPLPLLKLTAGEKP